MTDLFNQEHYNLHATDLEKAKVEASELLWENVEESVWWPQYQEFDEKTLVDEKINIASDFWHPAFVSFKISFTNLVTQISDAELRSILTFGCSRRLESMYRAVKDINQIAFWGRTELASKDEKARLDDAILLFYVHLFGFLDGLAIAMHQLKEIDERKYPRKRVDLLDSRFQRLIDLPQVSLALDHNKDWLTNRKDEFRNRFVHRIPPYVPPASHTEQDRLQFNKLQQKLNEAISAKRFNTLSDLHDEQEKLGSFCGYISFLENNEISLLLCTVLDDAMRFQMLALSVTIALLPDLLSNQGSFFE